MTRPFPSAERLLLEITYRECHSRSENQGADTISDYDTKGPPISIYSVHFSGFTITTGNWNLSNLLGRWWQTIYFDWMIRTASRRSPFVSGPKAGSPDLYGLVLQLAMTRRRRMGKRGRGSRHGSRRMAMSWANTHTIAKKGAASSGRLARGKPSASLMRRF